MVIMKATLATSPSDRGRPIPTSDKPCQYPGCGEIFNGIGAAKYCKKHKQPEYRKVLNAIRAEEKKKAMNKNNPNNSNMIIEHINTVATKTTLTCACGKDYEITLFPNINVYPKFCEQHRNPHQRDRLLRSLGMEESAIEADHHNLPGDEDNDSLAIDIEDIEKLEAEFGIDVFDGAPLEY
jgi:hypothetical protein